MGSGLGARSTQKSKLAKIVTILPSTSSAANPGAVETFACTSTPDLVNIVLTSELD